MNELEIALNCLVCSNQMCDPVTISCGHSFCRECTIKWCFQYKHYNCPVCRNKIDMEHLPNINVSLKALIDLVQHKKIDINSFIRQERCNTNTLNDLVTPGINYKLKDSKSSQSLLKPSYNHHLLLEKISNELNPYSDDLNSSRTHIKSENKPATKTDSTLSRLNAFNFPYYLFVYISGFIFILFLRCLKRLVNR